VAVAATAGVAVAATAWVAVAVAAPAVAAIYLGRNRDLPYCWSGGRRWR